MQELNEQQIKQYNSYRAEGMTPERALSLATKDSDNQYNPAIEKGVDNILFGKKSLTSAIGSGIKNAAYSGFKTVYDDTKQYGAGFALAKAPLSIAAGLGRGVGDVVGGVLETADDLTGEVASDFLMPVVESAVNSDVGQYLLQKGVELDQKGRGIPSDIFDALNLLGITAVAKSGAATSIKQSVLSATDDIVKTGVKGTVQNTFKAGGSLFDMFKRPKVTSPSVTKIEVNLGNIEKILADKLDNTLVAKSLDDIRDALKTQNPSGFSDDLLNKIDELLKDKSITPEEKATLKTYLDDIENVLKSEDGPSAVEGVINNILGTTDRIADGSVGIITRLSDEVVDRGLKTVDKIKSVPNAISERAKGAIDRRIVRVATNNPEQAAENILDLYKRSVVPGVKKKNKTIANIKQIDEAVKRSVPQLSKKYDVQDLEDFANAISSEKKAIFAEIEKGLIDAGDKGRAINMQPIVDELDALLKTERAEFSTPLRRAIERAKSEIVEELPDGTIQAKFISPTGAQDLIADLNAQLQAYYRGSTSGTNADVIVDNLVVNNLRKTVDDIVDDLGEGSFKELKSRYGDLKKMEDDVVHRAVFEAQKGGGLSDLTDILSAGDVAAGALDPAFFAKGVTQFLTKEVIKSLSDKDELVRQMFLYGKNLAN